MGVPHNDGIIPPVIADLGSHPVGVHLMKILNFVCFAAMCPFAVEEYWTMFTLGRRWLSPGNLVDISAINLQAAIFALHLTGSFSDAYWFGYLLACQMIFISIRLLRFLK